MGDDCLFCNIQNERLDNLLTGNPSFYALYDKAPVSKGHAIVIPKKHIVSLFGLLNVEVISFYEAIKQISEKVQKQFNPDGFNIGVNEGKAAGRTIEHLHAHIIPKYHGDTPDPVGGVRNIFDIYIPPAGNKMKYSKLVRDKVPEIIKNKGIVPITHIAPDEEYQQKLKEKLKEEIQEFSEENNEEELADILEVIYAICDFKKIGKESLELLRKRKAEERGGFKNKIILDETK